MTGERERERERERENYTSEEIIPLLFPLIENKPPVQRKTE